MQKKSFLSYLISLTAPALFFMIFTNTSVAASLTAEMIEVRNNKPERSKFYLQDNVYRMEVKDNGTPIAIIVNRNTGKTHVVNYAIKKFRAIDNDDPLSLIRNPFESYLHMMKQYAPNSLGTEKIQEIMCNKQEIKSDGKVTMTAWISLEYNFPVKIVNNLNNYTTLLSKIEGGPLDNSMFQIPSDFTEYVETTPEKIVPKKKSAITGREKAIAPVGKRLGPGGKIIVKVNPEKHITLILISESKDAADIFVNASNNGKPFTSSNLKNNINMKKMLDKKEFAFEKKLNPDTIEVKVITGLVRVIVNQESTPWAKEKSQETFIKEYSVGSFITDPKKKIVCDIIADSQDHPQSKIKVSFFKGIHENAIITETIILKNKQKKRYSFPLDNGIASGQVEVKKGDVQFILYPSSAVLEEGSKPKTVKENPTPVKENPTPVKTIKNDTVKNEDSPDKKTKPRKMVLVLDASGSMWGQIEGKAKITIAKKVLADLIDQIPSDFHTGLTVYGHRRKSDCNDIEMVIPVGPHNPATMKDKIKAINPKGKTPLSTAVKQAAKGLQYTKQRATVVLVSDGLETCNIDPCKLASELAMNGIDFTIHVISFDVKKEDLLGLKCLAENTGGLFLNASNARELRGALSKTVEKVKEAPEPIVEEPGDASLEAPEKAPAGSRIKVQWEGPASRNDFITIVIKNAPEGAYQSYRYTSTGNPLSIRVPDKVGLYEIRYVFGRTKATLAKIDLTVTPVTATIDAASSVPAGSQFKIVWTGPNNEGDFIAIVRESGNDEQYLNYAYTSSGSPSKIQAPAATGKYQLRYIMGNSKRVLARKDILVSEVSAKVEAKESALAGSDIQIIWIGPDNSSDYITIVPKGADEKAYFNYVYTSKGSPVKLKAPDIAGDYEIRYILNQSKKVLAKTAIKVTKISAQVNAPDTVKAGAMFQVNWQGPNYTSDYITIVPAGAKDGEYLSYAYTSKGSPATIQAPAKPGKYEVRYILNQSRTALARTSIIIN